MRFAWVRLTAGEVCISEIRTGEVRAGEERTGEIGFGELRLGEVCEPEVRVGEIGLVEGPASEVGAGENRVGKVQAGENRAAEIGAREIGARISRIVSGSSSQNSQGGLHSRSQALGRRDFVGVLLVRPGSAARGSRRVLSNERRQHLADYPSIPHGVERDPFQGIDSTELDVWTVMP